MGDININMDKNNKNNLAIVNEYNDFCKTHGLLQIIGSYTHVRKTSSSIIETTFSDHYSIFCTRKLTRNKHNKHKTIKIRSLKNYDKESYQERLKDINLPELDENSNIDDIYGSFAKQLGDVIESVAPLREIRVKNNTPEWFDGEILDEIRNRDKLHKKYKNTKLEENGLLYRSSRNRVQSLINTKKETYIRISLEENKRNSKKL